MTKTFTLSDDCNRMLKLRKQELKDETEKTVSFSDVILIALKNSKAETFIADYIGETVKDLQRKLPNYYFESLSYMGLILMMIERQNDHSKKLTNLIKVFYNALKEEFPDVSQESKEK